MRSISIPIGPGCIETAARTMRRRLEAKLLEGDLEDTKKDEFNFLTEFLDQTDFRSLRANQIILNGQVSIVVDIVQTEDGFKVTPLDSG